MSNGRYAEGAWVLPWAIGICAAAVYFVLVAIYLVAKAPKILDFDNKLFLSKPRRKLKEDSEDLGNNASTIFTSIFDPSKSNLDPDATRPDEDMDKLVKKSVKKTEDKGVVIETWRDSVFPVLTVLYLLAFNG